MELPEDIAGLVDDLGKLGFAVTHSKDGKWPGGPQVKLRRRAVRGVRAVEISVDRGMYEVMVQIGRQWYEPFAALRVLEGEPRLHRAPSHAERRRFTIEAVKQIRGTRRERRELRREALQYSQAYTRWAEGKAPHP